MARWIYKMTIVLVLMAGSASAQEPETLFNGQIRSGGFGGPVLKMTGIDSDFAVLVGGRGGWIINFDTDNALVLGGGAYGLANDLRMRHAFRGGRPLYLAFGYAGVELEYVNRTNELVHFSVQMLLGGGGVDFRERNYDRFDLENADALFVLEPGINLMLNVTRFFRIGTGIGYRFVSGVDRGTMRDADLRGLTGTITFKFGGF